MPEDGTEVQVCDLTEWSGLVRLLRSGRRDVMVVPELCGLRAVDGFAVLLGHVAHYGRGHKGAFMSVRRLAAEARLTTRYVRHLLVIAVQAGRLIRLDHGSRRGARYLLAAPGGSEGALRIAQAIVGRLTHVKDVRRACSYGATDARRRAAGDPASISAIGRALIEHNPWLAHEIAKGLGRGGDEPGVIRQGAMQVVTAILDDAGRRLPGGRREKVRDPRAYARAAFRNSPSRFAHLWPGAKIDVVGRDRLEGMISAVANRLRT